MHQPSTFRTRTAILLVLLFAASWMLRTVHGVFLHQHPQNHQVCTVIHDNGPEKTHLHDKRYAVEDCPVCDFCFAVPELVAVATVLVPPAFFHDSLVLFSPSFEVITSKDTTFRRGPPVL